MIDKKLHRLPLQDDATVIFKSDTLLVRGYLNRGSSTLFVVFDPMCDDPSLDRNAFAESFLARYRYDAVHVISARNDWYQDVGLFDALGEIHAVSRLYANVVTYGSSMGGYAALRFSKAVGARTAIAISPQYSVLPSSAPFERRWTDERRAVRWLHERPGDRLPHVEDAVVFYDDRWLDGRHAEAIRRDLPHMNAVVMPYVGYHAGTLLAETGLLSGAILDAAHGRLDIGALLAALRPHRHGSGQVLFTLARRQPVWRLRLKARLAQRACDLAPGEADVLSYAGIAHECVGEHQRALAFHADALRVSGARYVAVRMAHSLWRAGRRGEARELFDRAGRIRPFSALHEVAARMAIVDGAYDEGCARLIAIAASPGNRRGSLLARVVRWLKWSRVLRNEPIRSLVQQTAARQIRRTLLNPANILKELAEADDS